MNINIKLPNEQPFAGANINVNKKLGLTLQRPRELLTCPELPGTVWIACSDEHPGFRHKGPQSGRRGMFSADFFFFQVPMPRSSAPEAVSSSGEIGSIFHCALEGLLYISNGSPKLGDDYRLIHTDEFLNYTAFCDDFGPMNMSTVLRFIDRLDIEMKTSDEKILCLVHTGRRPFTNATFLLGAFMVIKLNFTAVDVLKRFETVDPTVFEPFRDATFDAGVFGLSLFDCWSGLERAKLLGWLATEKIPGIWGEIDIDEYDHYYDPLNGDLVQVSGLKRILF